MNYSWNPRFLVSPSTAPWICQPAQLLIFEVSKIPKKSLIEIYIKEKAKKREIIDYNVINGNFEKCEFCKKLFHPRGIYKHKMYCPINPNRKKKYSTKRKWSCRFCELLFIYNKERNLHQKRCSKNPDVIIIRSRMTNKDKIELFKREFPEIYSILTKEQINKFLDNHIKKKTKKEVEI